MENILAFLQEILSIMFSILLIVLMFAISVAILIGLVWLAAYTANFIHSL